MAGIFKDRPGKNNQRQHSNGTLCDKNFVYSASLNDKESLYCSSLLSPVRDLFTYIYIGKRICITLYTIIDIFFT